MSRSFSVAVGLVAASTRFSWSPLLWGCGWPGGGGGGPPQAKVWSPWEGSASSSALPGKGLRPPLPSLGRVCVLLCPPWEGSAPSSALPGKGLHPPLPLPHLLGGQGYRSGRD